MHTKAHPDDEHGGMLALLSRRDGARVSLVTLNRGQSGDNAIGPQLFDGLGLIRTEELAVSNEYYGVDTQYFTTVIDYGFSKRLDEAFEKWGRDNVLRDVVRIIRMDRPLVIISRFQGNQRDGHGNHQTAGLLTQEAFKAAADPAMFPEQIKEGLRPWQALKVYIGGMREDEDWTVKVDPGEYSPWLGTSYSDFARLGLSFQRSQNSGRYNPQAGPAPGYYKRTGHRARGRGGEGEGLLRRNRHHDSRPVQGPAPPRAGGGRRAARRHRRLGEEAVAAFSMANPSATVPALAEGLTATRKAIAALSAEPDAVFVLKIKEEQFQEAINTALGAEPHGRRPAAERARAHRDDGDVRATAGDAGTRARPDLRGAHAAHQPRIGHDHAERDRARRGRGLAGAEDRAAAVEPLGLNETASQRFTVTLANDVPLSSKPYFSRKSVLENRYTVEDMSQFGRPGLGPAGRGGRALHGARRTRRGRGRPSAAASRSCPTAT